MTTPKLTSQDRKDLDKFTKYFVYKCIQIIVQSRLGTKMKTKSKAFSTGSDWFNLAVKDLPEVFTETKKVFTGSTLLIGQHVCVELSLQTAEGETMVLETWSIGMSDSLDPNTRVSYTVYNRMSILLKSLICVSRATPAYKLSRKQSAETYVICYRVYMGEPQVYHLGDGFVSQRIGMVPTPLGTIVSTVMFRTKLLFSPHVSRDLSVDLKDDHFKPDFSPSRKANAPRPCYTMHHDYSHSRGSSSDETGGTSSESECCTTMFSCSPADFSPGHPHIQQGTPPPHSRQKRPSSGEIHELPHNAPCHLHRNPSFTGCQKRAAFAPCYENEQEKKAEQDDIPFMALLPAEPTDCVCDSPQGGDASGSDRTIEPMDSRSTGSSNKSASDPDASGAEDFVMVELKTPFAGNDANTDLGKFYRECQVAPQLCMFNHDANIEDAINTITDQLATFEANATDYDAFIKTLDTDED